MNITKFGGNGKVILDNGKSIAIKTLKNPKNLESRNRFIKEMMLLKEINKYNIDNIVRIIEINDELLEITMQLHDGDLTSIYDKTKGNVKFSVSLLLPIVKALYKLSELSPEIYHRDLKPANILISKKDNIELFLADFGCAYFNEETTGRDTPDFRAVGAQHYRAPEFDYGRVDNVTEKGDIFSLGKILWSMINGVNNEVFPYTLWFPKEYNLENRFEISSELIRVNLIIASCVDINPEYRPNYQMLINMLENIISNENSIDDSEEKKLKILKFEALRKVKEIEIKALTRNMLELFYQDFYKSLIGIQNIYGEMDLITHLIKNFSATYNSRNSSIDYKVNNDVESYIFSTSFRNIYISLNYHVSYSRINTEADKDLPSISCDYRITSKSLTRDLKIYYKNRVLHSEFQKNISEYKESLITSFISMLVEDYITAEI